VDDLREILIAAPENRRSGEIALVDKSSRIAETGLVYHDLLYDENAESHLALGAAYPECVSGSAGWNRQKKARNGLNESTVHIDIMIGAPDLEVRAVTYDNREIRLMNNGVFCLQEPPA